MITRGALLLRVARVSLALASACAALGACGYHAVHGGDAPRERLHATIARVDIADPVAADEVLAGAREALSDEGELASGDAYPRVEIEVLRVDESSEGVEATGGAPRARATGVAVVARAWLKRALDAAPERDTGDVRATSASAPGTSAPSDMLAHDAALRAAARRVGRKLGARIMGIPTASEE